MGFSGDRLKSLILLVPNTIAAVQENGFATLGHAIGKKPRTMALGTLLFYAVLSGGIPYLKGEGKIVFLNMETDFLKLWTLKNAPEYSEYKKATDLFPDVRSISLVETPVNGNSALSSAMFSSVIALQETIQTTLTAKYDNRRYKYTQLCARPASSLPCQFLSGAFLLLGGNTTRIAQLKNMEASQAALLSRAKWMIQQVPIHMRGLLPVLVVSTAKFPELAQQKISLPNG